MSHAYSGSLPSPKEDYFCVTGHRPNKLGGYSLASRLSLESFARSWLSKIWEKKQRAGVITGMALGWDIAIANAAHSLGLPFVAAVPFHGQDSQWPLESRAFYAGILSKAATIIEVFPPGFSKHKLLGRNKWMVDNSFGVLALWNGSGGGTQHCVNYANNKKVPVLNLWPHWQNWSD